MKEVLIIGNYGAGNLGDEAILESLLELCDENKIHANVISANPEQTRTHHRVPTTHPLPAGLRSLLKLNSKQTKTYFQNCNAVILGGGGLFTDEDFRAPLVWGRQAFQAMRNKKPLYCIGQSVGPLGSNWSRALAGFIFRYATQTIVRDPQSAQLLEQIGVEKNKIQVTSDLALLLTPSIKKPPRKRKRVLVSVRSWHNLHQKAIDALIQTLPQIADEVALLPMGDDDEKVLSQLAENTNLDAELVSPCSPREVLNQIATSDLVIGMRLHSLILATAQGVPAIGISYSEKVSNFCSQAKIPCLDLPFVSPEDILHFSQTVKTHPQTIAKLQKETEEKVSALLHQI